MAEFSLRIVASARSFYGGPSEIVIVPALDGEYGLWHTTMTWLWR